MDRLNKVCTLLTFKLSLHDCIVQENKMILLKAYINFIHLT